jgi:hypothetical protein
VRFDLVGAFGFGEPERVELGVVVEVVHRDPSESTE